MNVRELFEQGGLAMWPLLGLSILSLSVILERLWFWTSILSREKEIVNRVLEAAYQDWGVATEIAKRATGKPIGRFLYSPLRLYQPEPEVFRLALESSAEEELSAMRRGDKILEAIIALAPLLGLLGTIFGLINAFRDIRIGDLGTTDAASKATLGIAEALISTAGGLLVAITTLAFYRLFQVFLFNQVRIFRQAGNELELFYRLFWSQTMGDNPPTKNNTVQIPKTKSDTSNPVENSD